MPTLLSVKKQALELSESDRAVLAEALRRDAEMTSIPSSALSFEEMKRRIASR